MLSPCPVCVILCTSVSLFHLFPVAMLSCFKMFPLIFYPFFLFFAYFFPVFFFPISASFFFIFTPSFPAYYFLIFNFFFLVYFLMSHSLSLFSCRFSLLYLFSHNFLSSYPFVVSFFSWSVYFRFSCVLVPISCLLRCFHIYFSLSICLHILFSHILMIFFLPCILS